MKDTILWILFVGIPVCYGAISAKTGRYYFRSIIINNLRLCVILEFLISSVTFNLVIELILVFVTVVLVALEYISGTKSEYYLVRKTVSFLMTIIGFTVLGFTILAALEIYLESGGMDLLVSFLIPVVFSILYIPMTYFFGLWGKYELIFKRMIPRQTKDKKTRRRQRRKILWVCGLSYRRINSFESYGHQMYVGMSEQDFDRVIKEFKGSLEEKENSA